VKPHSKKRGGMDGKSKVGRSDRQGLGHKAAELSRRAGRAWAEGRPDRKQARAKMIAAERADLKRLRGATSDALRSARAGLWNLIKHRSLRKGAQRVKEAWLKHRAKRKDPALADEPKPSIAATVRRPTAASTTSTTGAPAVSGYHFVAPAMEGAQAAANYAPTGMMQVGRDFAGLQQALELHAEAMKITVENADAKHPLAPQIIEMMRQIHSLQLKAAEMASELPIAFRKLHDVDIARIETPRKGPEGERMWDVASN